MISSKKKVSQLPYANVVKDDAKIIVIQDNKSYVTDVKNYFARIVYEKRHDYVSDVSYCGQAPLGSPETLPYWTISKIVINSDGSVVVTRAYNVDWTNHLTHTYG